MVAFLIIIISLHFITLDFQLLTYCKVNNKRSCNIHNINKVIWNPLHNKSKVIVTSCLRYRIKLCYSAYFRPPHSAVCVGHSSRRRGQYLDIVITPQLNFHGILFESNWNPYINSTFKLESYKLQSSIFITEVSIKAAFCGNGNYGIWCNP